MPVKSDISLPDERGPAKIEHVIESRFRLLLIFRH
jgi:hypothetical protein